MDALACGPACDLDEQTARKHFQVGLHPVLSLDPSFGSFSRGEAPLLQLWAVAVRNTYRLPPSSARACHTSIGGAPPLQDAHVTPL
jgi:hypothetical protein